MPLFEHPLPQPAVIPTTAEEMHALNWTELDVLILTGDALVDHPSFGAAVIARILGSIGLRVGVIPQPDWKNPDSICGMGRPRLGVGITAGNLDSMVNLYTVGRRLRKDDAYSENGVPNLRPPHAATVYTQLAKKAFPGIYTVLGGIEASLRRIAHYDYWQDRMRPSILADSKADIVVYGMGERQTIAIFSALARGEQPGILPGTARFLTGKESAAFADRSAYVELDSYEVHQQDKRALMRSMVALEKEMNPACGRGFIQAHGDRLVRIEPPAQPLSQAELDAVYDLPFTGLPHPRYTHRIPAFETIQFSIPAVRGCPGGCAFCGLVAHQGRFVQSRSVESVERQTVKMTEAPNFRGTISDVGGAAGNIFGHGVKSRDVCAKCHRVSCLFPKMCPNYKLDDTDLLRMLRTVRAVPKVKHVFINSGIRLDLAVRQKEVMRELIRYHVSGHLKVAPEHLHPRVLELMRKNPPEDFYDFVDFFEHESRACGKEQYLIPLFISNFPGCTEREMDTVDRYLTSRRWSPQQVQDYIPLPMTMGAAMYYCGETAEGEPIPVNRGLAERRDQVNTLKRKRHVPQEASARGRFFAQNRGGKPKGGRK